MNTLSWFLIGGMLSGCGYAVGLYEGYRARKAVS